MSARPPGDAGAGGARQRAGLRGERLAEAYLRRLGYRTVARRARAGRGELDLVMRDGRTVVFVEVKFRSDAAAQPQYAVNAGKRRHLTSAARSFLAARGWEDAACRFDIVTLLPDGNGEPRVTHFPGAFAPTRW